jgi:cytoskeleton protein RodZ
MRISPRQVEAIEADRYGDLPGAVFVRGFVRNYARLLRLDPVPLLHALEPALGGDVPLRAHEIAGTLPETNRRSHGRFWWLVIAIVIVLAALAALYEWWRARSGAEDIVPPGADVLTPATPQPPGPAIPPPQDAVPLAPERLHDTPPVQGAAPLPPQQGGAGMSAAQRALPMSSSRGEGSVSPSPGAAPMSSAQETTSMSPVQGAAATSPSEPAPAALPVAGAEEPPATAAQAITGSGRMQIEAVADSWLEVRDGDGMVQFSGTIAAGATRSFEAKPPLQVVVGNASGVHITYNGRPFDLASHATRNIARFRLE